METSEQQDAKQKEINFIMCRRLELNKLTFADLNVRLKDYGLTITMNRSSKKDTKKDMIDKIVYKELSEKEW